MLVFAALFVAALVVTQLAATHVGERGVFSLAAVLGLVDVDPFILGLAQSTGPAISLSTAASAILVATASNNLMKGVYAVAFGEKKTGRATLVWLVGLAALGLVPLLWV